MRNMGNSILFAGGRRRSGDEDKRIISLGFALIRAYHGESIEGSGEGCLGGTFGEIWSVEEYDVKFRF